MKKILVTMLFLCFALAGVLAKTNRELIIESTNRPLMPRSIVEMPKVFQSDASLSIVLPETASYVTVSIINKETGAQVYMNMYAMMQNIQIDLGAEDEGEYSIIFSVGGAEYTGDFTL